MSSRRPACIRGGQGLVLAGARPMGAPRMALLELEPDIADEAAWAEILTPYDQDHLAVYLRLLDAEREGADWREAARLLLRRDPALDPDGARLCWESHLARARWMTEVGYRLLLAQGRSDG